MACLILKRTPASDNTIHLIGESSRLLETLLRIHSEFYGIREDRKKAGEATSLSLEEASEEELPMPVPQVH
jgi:hypothetical protein